VKDDVGAFSDPVTFTLTVLPNKPVVKGSLATITDFKIDLQESDTTYILSVDTPTPDTLVDFTTACTDPNSDPITYTIEYN